MRWRPRRFSPGRPIARWSPLEVEPLTSRRSLNLRDTVAQLRVSAPRGAAAARRWRRQNPPQPLRAEAVSRLYCNRPTGARPERRRPTGAEVKRRGRFIDGGQIRPAVPAIPALHRRPDEGGGGAVRIDKENHGAGVRVPTTFVRKYTARDSAGRGWSSSTPNRRARLAQAPPMRTWSHRGSRARVRCRVPRPGCASCAAGCGRPARPGQGSLAGALGDQGRAVQARPAAQTC